MTDVFEHVMLEVHDHCHRAALVRRAEKERLAAKMVSGRSADQHGPVASVGDLLVSVGLWLRARSHPFQAS